jgi:hypothetical protein
MYGFLTMKFFLLQKWEFFIILDKISSFFEKNTKWQKLMIKTVKIFYFRRIEILIKNPYFWPIMDTNWSKLIFMLFSVTLVVADTRATGSALKSIF